MKCIYYDNCNHIDCESSFCMKKYKLDYYYDCALLSQEQRKHLILRVDSDGSDIDAFNKLSDIEHNILKFVDSGKNLYLHSQTAGNGKTSWSLRLIQGYINKKWFNTKLQCIVLFINVPRFLLSIKDNIDTKNDYAQHIKDNVLDADLVVWDDIGTKQSTTFENENLLSIIDSRINLNKSNIFTSNLSSDELHIALGDRLHSRICNQSIDIELKGMDKRFLKK